MISDDLVAKALSIVTSSPANHEYFFSTLKSPEWIRPLRKAGRFRKPAQILREGRGFRFPSWPESSYLTRMAALAPKLVRDIIVEAEPTDNERVHQDYVEAALNMPAEIAVDIAKLEEKWIRTRERLYTLYPDKVANLIGHLATNGGSQVGLTLARTLLAIAPGSGEESNADDTDDFTISAEPNAKFDQWHHRRVLDGVVPVLAKAAPELALRLFSDLLEAALKVPSARHHTPEEDYSWIWRPDVAHENHQDFKEALVSAVRDTALQMSITPEATAKVGRLLCERRWRIFRRLAAYVVDRADGATEATRELLLDSVEYADFPGQSPEFDRLLANSFKALAGSDQEVILGIIDVGPNLTPFERRRENEGKPATAEELSDLADQWRVRWLRRIRDALPVNWHQRYKVLVERLGEPPLHDPPFKTGGSFVGPTSPKNHEELRGLKPDELINLLKNWQSKGEWNSPSPEGLGRTLTEVLSAEPQLLAAQADGLRGLDPTYVRSAMEGFRGALKNGKNIEWDSVLTLCHWVVTQPRVILGRKTNIGDSDPDWSWTRTAIARLMLEGVQREQTNSVPIKQRERIWKLINSVLDDPDPYEESETRYGKGMFIGSLSLNTTRGVAVEAVVDYGLWVRRHLLPKLPKEEGTLSTMPEVEAALEKHLYHDRSPAVREVYGRRFPWIVGLDKAWAARHANAIFRQADGDLGQIALANYVLFCPPYDDVSSIMAVLYEHAVDTIGHGFRGDNSDIDQHLAVHLMNLYWRGKLTLEDSTGVVRRFFEKADAKLRGHAIWSVGRGLYDETVALPSETTERLRRLWEWRLSETGQVRGDEEITHFGYWFASAKFDVEWSMRNLLEVLRLRGRLKPDHLVAERLCKVSHDMPAEAVQALGFLIEGDHEGWSIYGWQEHARTLLEVALSKGTQAREEALRVINLLGSRGHLGYRDLMNQQ